MKVTFVLPYAGLQGGVRVLAIYAERLRRRGHQVTVVSMPQSIGIKRKVASVLLGNGFPQAEPSHFDAVAVEHRVLDRARPVVDADVPDADVVVATYYTTADGVRRLSPSKGAKAIFIQHYEVEEGRENAALDSSWMMPLHKITISRWLVELARDQFGDGDVSLVPNSVDLEQFFAPPRDKRQRPTVGFLYNSFSLKGMDVALAALKMMAEAVPSLRVVTFGSEHPSWKYPLPPSVEFHYRPDQSGIREIYASCDVWMCSSHTEGFHLPLLEAMACRCPVVSTRVGGPLDVIEEGVNGFLVPVKNPEALATRLIEVLRLPPTQWRDMSNAALATASRYTWDDATTLFERALERAMQRHARLENVVNR